MGFDLWIFYAINHAPHPPALDFAARIIHYATRGGLLYYPIFAFLLLSKNTRTRAPGVIAGVAALLTYLTTDFFLKSIIERARPFQELADVILVASPPANSSFPSGQAAIAFAVATACLLLFPKKVVSYGALAFAVLVSLDRIYMGHHYPSDVLAGAVIGSLISIGVFLYFRSRRVLVLATPHGSEPFAPK